MRLIKAFRSQVRLLLYGKSAIYEDTLQEIEKKPVFGRTPQRTPFYSLHHWHNQFLIAVAGVSFMYWQFFNDVYNSGERNNRFEKERTRFLQELDDQEARASLKVQQEKK